jgi:ABC-type sugar transport system substrate-binding protein
MKRTNRVLFLAAVVSLAVTAGPAIAQQKGTKSGVVVMPRPDDLFYLISREAVQKDLGISDDVARKLRSVLDDSRAAIQKEYQDAGINPRDYPNNLTAEQRQKYREIGKKEY